LFHFPTLGFGRALLSGRTPVCSQLIVALKLQLSACYYNPVNTANYESPSKLELAPGAQKLKKVQESTDIVRPAIKCATWSSTRHSPGIPGDGESAEKQLHGRGTERLLSLLLV
jgi:hypothetical protein